MHDPLVLLPGMNCSARLWAPVRARLAARQPETAVLEALPDEASVDAAVDRLLGTLPERFALAGLSLGGIVAMALVRRAPARVTRLCLMSTNARGPRPDQCAAWASQRRQLAAGRSARDLQRDLLPMLLHPDHRSPQLDETVLAMADDVGNELLDRQLAMQATRVDERPTLSRITVPTLVLAADGDALCPVDRHQEIASLVPGARLAVLAGVGHLSPLEAPDAVAAELAGWLGAD